MDFGFIAAHPREVALCVAALLWVGFLVRWRVVAARRRRRAARGNRALARARAELFRLHDNLRARRAVAALMIASSRDEDVIELLFRAQVAPGVRLPEGWFRAKRWGCIVTRVVNGRLFVRAAGLYGADLRARAAAKHDDALRVVRSASLERDLDDLYDEDPGLVDAVDAMIARLGARELARGHLRLRIVRGWTLSVIALADLGLVVPYAVCRKATPGERRWSRARHEQHARRKVWTTVKRANRAFAPGGQLCSAPDLEVSGSRAGGRAPSPVPAAA